jgi:hypothetical protein
MTIQNLENLKKGFSGQVLLPKDEGYIEASTTMVAKGKPAVVFLPKTSEDVAAAIKYAKDNHLLLSVRSGGHSISGYSTNNDGVVINLTKMNSVEVIDEKQDLIKVGPGAMWIEVANTLLKHGLAISSGDTKTVGVGGLTLGGGIGWMVRKFGLAIDSLVGAEIVTASGKILHLSEKENPDLFWAIRGGGGNFGVVTSFEFKAHKVGKIFYGNIQYKIEDLAKLLKAWRDHMRTVDDNLTTILNVMEFPGSPPILMIGCCYGSDNESDFKKAVDPLLKIGTVISNDIGLKDYPEVLGDAHPTEGIKVVVNNVIAKEFSDELIDTIADVQKNTKNFILQIRTLGGAIKSIPENATAFANRNGEVLLLSPTFLTPTATEAEITESLKPWERIGKFGTGAYVQFFSTQDDKNLGLTYPSSVLPRLQQIKKQYDPDNLFHQNFNIK